MKLPKKFMKVLEVSADEFDASLAKQLELHPYVLIHVFASKDLFSGKSWCGDCETAFPLIEKFAAFHETSVMLSCPAGDRETYRDSKNFYKNHPLIAVQYLPTLYLITKVSL
jgi:thiol-disulfide isomerase/thioredoxin